ncbi:hypothetical protein O3P69_005898 [Scylla paramamosain]|uniref:Uncharacterized protein n=1 Tax=Scylla paramamosain TaxID=85552 RepID=A0AAW0U622_SCYPA
MSESRVAIHAVRMRLRNPSLIPPDADRPPPGAGVLRGGGDGRRTAACTTDALLQCETKERVKLALMGGYSAPSTSLRSPVTCPAQHSHPHVGAALLPRQGVRVAKWWSLWRLQLVTSGAVEAKQNCGAHLARRVVWSGGMWCASFTELARLLAWCSGTRLILVAEEVMTSMCQSHTSNTTSLVNVRVSVTGARTRTTLTPPVRGPPRVGSDLVSRLSRLPCPRCPPKCGGVVRCGDELERFHGDPWMVGGGVCQGVAEKFVWVPLVHTESRVTPRRSSPRGNEPPGSDAFPYKCRFESRGCGEGMIRRSGRVRPVSTPMPQQPECDHGHVVGVSGEEEKEEEDDKEEKKEDEDKEEEEDDQCSTSFSYSPQLTSTTASTSGDQENYSGKSSTTKCLMAYVG